MQTHLLDHLTSQVVAQRKTRSRPFALGTFFLGTLCVLTSWEIGRADVVIFKDGYTLQGKIKRETTYFVDPASNVQMNVPKLNGFFMVDDEARRIYFSQRQIQDVPDREPPRAADIRLQSPIVRRPFLKVPPWQIVAVTDWDKKWNRVLTINAPGGRRRVQQHLSLLTPKVVRIDARDYNWTIYYLTQELDPDVVRKLLVQHPDLKLNGNSGDAGKRFRIFRFLLQAGWYDKAAAELDGIARDLPDQKDKVETARGELKTLLAWQFVDLLEEAQKNGRHYWVQTRLANFPRQGMEEKLIVRVSALRATYETLNKQLSRARHHLDDVMAHVSDPAHGKLLCEAASVISTELNEDTVNRLEAFINLAQQAEQARQHGRTPDQTPEQLLALAVSGWLVGSSSAEAQVETAVRLWRSRQFVLDYQKAASPTSRHKMVTDYESKQGVPFDELAQVIRFLPPPEPFELALMKKGPWTLGALPFHPAPIYWALFSVQKLLPPTPAKLTVNLPASIRTGPSYLVQPPPEYHAGRSYPVLFVLHEAGEKPEEMLQRWSKLAAQHGYFLVAPVWEGTLANSEYDYSVEEQGAVVDVLRDLRRHFQIDSDLVFLFGLGEGAKMAFDVGLSHPDQFAGVMPMGASPHNFARAYKQNAQYLPFYVMDGDYDGDTAKENRLQFEHWIPHSYPAIYVQYKGRGREWFAGELPFLFDWMSRKQRAHPFPELGRSGGSGAGTVFGEEFRSMRPTDNHFYWLSGEDLYHRLINSADRWNARLSSAVLQAKIGEGNHIYVNAQGFKRVVVWLGPGKIDFDKPVTVYRNSQLYWSNRKVTPNLGTLLEDFYLQGDRQRLFLAKLEIPL
jgi:pimeloyl-ACP methyl ester carboxylesterase